MKPEVSHSHGHAHEHELEPQYGLPEKLPDDERILWQGSPDWKTLARYGFHTRKLTVYFAVLIAIRVAVVLTDGGDAHLAMVNVMWLALLAAVAVGIMAGVAYLSARTSVYTITTKRVVMRVGMVLTVAYNLPFKRIASAGFRALSGGKGDIPLALMGEDRIAYLHLWPHARPWHFAKTEPMLRSLSNAEEVARILTKAWSDAVGKSASITSSAGMATGATSLASRDASTHSNRMGMA